MDFNCQVGFFLVLDLKSLAKKGKLVVVHACGGDPGNKIIKKIRRTF